MMSELMIVDDAFWPPQERKKHEASDVCVGGGCEAKTQKTMIKHGLMIKLPIFR
jgi:hypothetical protein